MMRIKALLVAAPIAAALLAAPAAHAEWHGGGGGPWGRLARRAVGTVGTITAPAPVVYFWDWVRPLLSAA